MIRSLVSVLVWIVFALMTTQRVSAQRTGEEILKQVEHTNEGVNDYTVQLELHVDLERLKVPSMHVTMYFKKPDKIHFSSESFALLPKESMSLSPAQLRSKYDIAGAIDTVEGGIGFSRLELKPKNDKTGLRRMYAYVDREHGLICRIISAQPDGRTITAQFHHQKVQGFWLPSELTVQFASTSSETSTPDPLEQLAPMRGAQIPRLGKISIHYSEYRVNTGLKDDVFETPNTTKEP